MEENKKGYDRFGKMRQTFDDDGNIITLISWKHQQYLWREMIPTDLDMCRLCREERQLKRQEEGNDDEICYQCHMILDIDIEMMKEDKTEEEE